MCIRTLLQVRSAAKAVGQLVAHILPAACSDQAAGAAGGQGQLPATAQRRGQCYIHTYI